jgi:hypothetical protein
MGLDGSESSSATATSGSRTSVTPTIIFGNSTAASPGVLNELASDAGSSPLIALLLAAGLVIGYFVYKKYA